MPGMAPSCGGLNTLDPLPLDSAVHLIQVALTPVFLLSGIAALLNVFAGRLARVSDRLDTLSAAVNAVAPESAADIASEITVLHRRLFALDTAVVLGTAGAAATCVAILALFLLGLGLGQSAVAGILRLFFGTAIICTFISVTAFGSEMTLSSRGLRARMDVQSPRHHRRRTRAGRAPVSRASLRESAGPDPLRPD